MAKNLLYSIHYSYNQKSMRIAQTQEATQIDNLDAMQVKEMIEPLKEQFVKYRP